MAVFAKSSEVQDVLPWVDLLLRRPVHIFSKKTATSLCRSLRNATRFDNTLYKIDKMGLAFPGSLDLEDIRYIGNNLLLLGG